MRSARVYACCVRSPLPFSCSALMDCWYQFLLMRALLIEGDKARRMLRDQQESRCKRLPLVARASHLSGATTVAKRHCRVAAYLN